MQIPIVLEMIAKFIREIERDHCVNAVTKKGTAPFNVVATTLNRLFRNWKFNVGGRRKWGFLIEGCISKTTLFEGGGFVAELLYLIV